jgi:hypothetical protein
VRGPNDTRTIDIPGFVDPPNGPKPLVVYGSATNQGSTPIAHPFVRVTWRAADGTATSVEADVVRPGTTDPTPSLAPGQSGDVIVVVNDPALAARVATLTPQLEGGTR